MILKLKSKYEIVTLYFHVQLDCVENDVAKALEDSDLALILTEHNEYKDLIKYVPNNMKQAIIFDTKNIVNQDDSVTYYNFNNVFDI